MIICVDLDGTLCEDSNGQVEDWQEWYKQVRPISDAIKKINLLSKKHAIVIYTARPNIDYEITHNWLTENGVIFDKLVMDKVKADLYIDNASKRIGELDAP